jgi:asparagine synthase (glutamine-hydrolysing)
MCGIGGTISPNNPVNIDELQSMKHSLNHRGPDGNGIWINESQSIGLVHARLSILDLSEFASQPMISSNKRYVLSFNGEIYNYLDLKKELESQFSDPFRSTGDSEFLVQAFSVLNVKSVLKKLDGMFAIALFDSEKNKLYLARDRFGEKPLYYYWDGQNFIFGSEVSTLMSSKYFNQELDSSSMDYFLRYGYMPSNKNIFKKTFQVQPGGIIEFDLNTNNITEDYYWNPIEQYKLLESNNEQLKNSPNNLEDILEKTVQSRLISDVPIGCFLSSGTDSSLIASLACQFSKNKIDTFTIGFKEKEWDESKNAQKISKIIGSNHNELIIDSKNILESVIETINLFDQPFGDSSAIPTNLLSNFASKKVKVALSGDGGDELFSGYDRYTLAAKIHKVPFPLRSLSSNIIKATENLGAGKMQLDKIFKLRRILEHERIDLLYDELLSNPMGYTLKNTFPPVILAEMGLQEKIGIKGFMQMTDILNYLPNDILVKVDRAAMMHSLETRAPFLNPALFEYCFYELYQKNEKIFNNKECLKTILQKFLPDELIFNKKKGFSIPIVHWLRGPLKEWGEEMLYKSQNSNLSVINNNDFLIMWEEHQDNKRNWHHGLWALFVLTQWLDAKNLL